MIKKFLIIMGCLIVLELLTMLGLASFYLGDARPPKTDAMIGNFLYTLLTYVFGFPMVLFNSKAPFSIDVPVPVGILLVLVNNCVLSLLIVAILEGFKKLRKISN